MKKISAKEKVELSKNQSEIIDDLRVDTERIDEHSISPHFLKELLFHLSMTCKKNGWHQTGLCLSIGAEQMEFMIEQKALSQSIDRLKEIVGGKSDEN